MPADATQPGSGQEPMPVGSRPWRASAALCGPSAVGGFADLLRGWQQQPDEDCDDGDDHQQFDQRETASAEPSADFRHETPPEDKNGNNPNKNLVTATRRGNHSNGPADQESSEPRMLCK